MINSRTINSTSIKIDAWDAPTEKPTWKNLLSDIRLDKLTREKLGIHAKLFRIYRVPSVGCKAFCVSYKK